MNTKRRCKNCKDYFYVEDMIQVGPGWFCSDSCLTDVFTSASKKRAQHAKNYKPKPKKKNDIPVAVRDHVYQRDGRRCRFCGITRGLHLHHVKYRSEGGTHTSDNLLTLCWKHHDLIHSDKALYQQLCFRMIERAEEGDKATLMKGWMVPT